MVFHDLPLTAFTAAGSSMERQVPSPAKALLTVPCSAWLVALPPHGAVSIDSPSRRLHVRVSRSFTHREIDLDSRGRDRTGREVMAPAQTPVGERWHRAKGARETKEE